VRSGGLPSLPARFPPRVPYCQAVALGAETEQERGRRHYQRTLFDRVAQLYAASRRGYPAELVDFVVTTAGLRVGSTVLEVGCGPGQLTERLAGYGFNVTAIDIGPSMIAAARRRLADSAVSFQVTSFEDFAAAEASFDLICSGTAFHWVDPEVKFSKPARLLRPGGRWLDQGAVWGQSAEQIRMTYRALHGHAPTTGIVREHWRLSANVPGLAAESIWRRSCSARRIACQASWPPNVVAPVW
jgi:SAM-dependent methyltransferase